MPTLLEKIDPRLIISYLSVNLELVLLYISLFLSIIFLIFALRAARNTPGLIYFFLAFIFLPSYLNLKFFFGPIGFFKISGVIDSWLRHPPFYFGQLFFFLFVMSLVSLRLEEVEKKKVRLFIFLISLLYAVFLIFPSFVFGYHGVNILNKPIAFFNMLLFLEDQGVQHILALLFFLLTFAIVRLKPFYAGLEPFIKVASWFFIANTCFIIIHFLEYSLESLHLLPFLFSDLGEIIKFTFQYFGIIFLYIGVVRFVRLRESE